MKLVIAVLLGLTVVTACSIDHRSGDFACTKQSDCNSGRTCTGGYCVLPGGTVDAPKSDGPRNDGPLPDASNVCPQQCTSCEMGSHTCHIDCASTSCNGPVACPSGWNCQVACSVANACRSGVSCVGATSCNITCSGSNSCRDISCGLGKCDVTCSGSGACRNTNCGMSCGCDVKCGPGSLCDTTTCTGLQCRNGLGCLSTIPTCNSCP